ncbi:MAG TPA: signal peptidase I [bacterium]|nr:signal peptidase I [bacterium]
MQNEQLSIAKQERFIYSGRSMKPTFKNGQRLYVRPAVKRLRPGDVVVFAPHTGSQPIVHRVVAVSAAGLITRGDHNLKIDPRPVSATDLIGRVDFFQQQGQLHRVLGGCRGLLNAKLRWFRLACRAKAYIVLFKWYRALVTSSSAAPLIRRLIRPEFDYITLNSDRGPLVKAMLRGRVVARWEPRVHRFQCRKPYDLWLQQDGRTLKDG